MLAPRKKLHSTPASVLDVISQWVTPLKPGDVVCDIGCGDGRVLLHLAKTTTISKTSDVSFVGLDINPDRVAEAQEAHQLAVDQGLLSPIVSVTFHSANAMESVEYYQHATVIFLYLIPRGLKIFKPMLYQVLRNQKEEQQQKQLLLKKDSNNDNHTDNDDNEEPMLRVMTYMSPLPEEQYTKREVCQVEHQPGAAWPVFFYHLRLKE